jgi:hypothetical protein
MGTPSLSDIFLSYKREEQSVAKVLADALERQGWSVWWDPKLRAGERFDDVIEKALRDAKCVIVLWSKRSIESQYVRVEATYALNREKLVPVAIDEAIPPFRFEGIQTARLSGWDGSDTFPEFKKLLQDLVSVLGPPPCLATEEERTGKGRSTKESPREASEGASDGRQAAKAEASAAKRGAVEPELDKLVRVSSAPSSAAVSQHYTPRASGDLTDLLEAVLLWTYWPVWLAIPIFNIAGSLSNTYVMVVASVFAVGGVLLGWRRRGVIGWYWWFTVLANGMIILAIVLDPQGFSKWPFYVIMAYVVAGPPIGLWLRTKARRVQRTWRRRSG